MSETTDSKTRLLALLKERSIFYGDFNLSSGGKSRYYIDCKLTTLDPEGAWLTGTVLHQLIRAEEKRRGVSVDAIGGLTMGADPIALATGMISHESGDAKPLRVFCVRKNPKAHGQTKLIEGNFKKGDCVVVIDDVVTQGESTIKAIQAVEGEGGKVLFVTVLVDRREGGKEKIERMGYSVVPAFTRDEVLDPDKLHNLADTPNG